MLSLVNSGGLSSSALPQDPPARFWRDARHASLEDTHLYSFDSSLSGSSYHASHETLLTQPEMGSGGNSKRLMLSQLQQPLLCLWRLRSCSPSRVPAVTMSPEGQRELGVCKLVFLSGVVGVSEVVFSRRGQRVLDADVAVKQMVPLGADFMKPDSVCTLRCPESLQPAKSPSAGRMRFPATTSLLWSEMIRVPLCAGTVKKSFCAFSFTSVSTVRASYCSFNK